MFSPGIWWIGLSVNLCWVEMNEIGSRATAKSFSFLLMTSALGTSVRLAASSSPIIPAASRFTNQLSYRR